MLLTRVKIPASPKRSAGWSLPRERLAPSDTPPIAALGGAAAIIPPPMRARALIDSRHFFKELEDDLGIKKTSNELDSWARQGVLLLNATLTVRAHSPNSHQALGWERFTDFIIQQISAQKEGVVFVLWGAFAQKKEAYIDTAKHFVIKSAHPSPFSVHRGFFGSRPFSKINEYLKSKNKKEISW
mgnify:CR=1 FL=1